MDKRYQVQEFAALAGVTVRALHHYDRLGLLRPRRTGSGYRLYGRQELERLEQIVALKFIGIPLHQIKAILDRNPSRLPDALHIQRIVLGKNVICSTAQFRALTRPSSRLPGADNRMSRF